MHINAGYILRQPTQFWSEKQTGSLAKIDRDSKGTLRIIVILKISTAFHFSTQQVRPG